ncbi:MAG: M23 family metallopeptidase [Syntrophales bacterium]|nr:M23 family metallopeptidase [Syntrophales bacterium]
MKKLRPFTIVLVVFVVVAAIGGGWWFFTTSCEGEKPVLKFNQDISAIGRQNVFDITFMDQKSGLRNTVITIVQDNKTTILSSIDYPQKGIKKKSLSLIIDPLSLKLHDGKATLNISAVDYSLRKNKTSFTRHVNIDLTPPQIYPLNPVNNINPGGACVILYRTSEPVSTSGVQVENHFSPGYPITLFGKSCIITYFALPIHARNGQINIRIVAKDHAGNESSSSLPCLIRDKKFRRDKMNLSESFLQQKMPEFQLLNPNLRGKTPLETFIYVNGLMRKDNDETIETICQKTSPRQLWEGTFLRMKNASPMALFGDKRTYLYEGKAVGESIHLGVDLASTKHAPVEAANHGIVAFGGFIGIYGNTILIDHGLGLFTHYAHLGTINVRKGQQVKKGEVIGYTGLSGLAGGDHLHFGVVVGGRFVNPQEWWDAHWITDNISKKMELL